MTAQENYDDFVAQLSAIKAQVERVYADSPDLPTLQTKICHMRCTAEMAILGTIKDCDAECGGDEEDDAYQVEEVDGDDGPAGPGEPFYMEDEARTEILDRYEQRKAKDCGCGSSGRCSCQH